MLCLKRMTYFNEFIRDTIDERIIGPGEYYYEDMDIETGKSTGLILSVEHYYELKDAKRKEDFEKSEVKKWYNRMESEKEYKDRLREQEEALRQREVLGVKRLQELM